MEKKYSIDISFKCDNTNHEKNNNIIKNIVKLFPSISWYASEANLNNKTEMREWTPEEHNEFILNKCVLIDGILMKSEKSILAYLTNNPHELILFIKKIKEEKELLINITYVTKMITKDKTCFIYSKREEKNKLKEDDSKHPNYLKDITNLDGIDKSIYHTCIIQNKN